MGLSTFHNKFLSVTGNTPNVFIIKYKMRKTVELLKNSNKTITEISEMLGFKSVSYFSTAFKKENGILPSEFLKVNRR